MFLLLVLARNPVAFVRAVLLNFALQHPGFAFAEYVSKRSPLVLEAVRHGLYVENLFSKGLLTSWYAVAHGKIGRASCRERV